MKVNFIVNENKPLSPGENINILKELATLDPLEDRAFKILLSDDTQFALLAEAFTGKNLYDERLININGEIALTVNGRLVRLDTLRDTGEGYINVESQIVAADFPFKRHVFHSAIVYINGIQKGDSWQSLKPVTSIVVYKDKGDAKLIETGCLAGDIVKTNDDSQQLCLIAVNTKKWRDAESDALKVYLSTLYHGILTEDNKSDFADIDIEDPVFIKFQVAVKLACARTKQQEYKEKGDEFMATQYATFLTEEERLYEREQTLELARKIVQMLDENVPIPEIAKACRVTTRVVESFITKK